MRSDLLANYLHESYMLFSNALKNEDTIKSIQEEIQPYKKLLQKHTTESLDNVTESQFHEMMELDRLIHAFNFKVREQRLDFNSIFLHLHTIFERFIYQFSIQTLQKDKSFRDKYISIYTSYIIKNIDQFIAERSIHDLKKLTDPKKLILDIAKLGSIFETSKNIFYVEKVIKKELFYAYHEIRERRNLLTHRGTSFDSTYKEALSRKLSAQAAKAYYNDVIMKELNASGTNASVTYTYLMRTFNVLTNYAIALFICGSKKSVRNKTKKSQEFYFNIHDFLIDFGLNSSPIQRRIFNAFISSHVKVLIKDKKSSQLLYFDDETIMNILICNYLAQSSTKEFSAFCSDKLNNLLISSLPDNYKMCFEYYYNRDWNSYKKVASKISPTYHRWFMTCDLKSAHN